MNLAALAVNGGSGGLAWIGAGVDKRVMTVGTLSSAWFAPLFDDVELAPLFGEQATYSHFLAFEVALIRAHAAAGLVDKSTADAALAAMVNFKPDVAAIRTAMLSDGVPAPAYVRQLKAHCGDAASAVHIGATSQDLIDTATAQALRLAGRVYAERLPALCDALRDLEARFGANPLMGRTRMQAALPITVADRLANWSEPLRGHLENLDDVRAGVEMVQYGGPVGAGLTGDDGQGRAVVSMLSAELGLGLPGRAWHTRREGLVDYGQWLALVTGTLGKMGQDIALMAQQGIDEIAIDGGGSSSAMPHKQNPILAEKLVTLARFNATQMAGLHHAMVHEQERSGSAWALEWMILPQMVVATGRALSDANALLRSITRIGTPG